MKRFTRERSTSLLPVPIANGPADNDVAQFEQHLSLDEAESRTLESLTTPESVIRQVGRCRVVVTGSYHAGVFALSQGIPVVGLSKSAYYRDKFAGLAEQFEVGCIVVNLSETDLPDQLEHAIARLWDEAPSLREPLLRSAERQIAASQEAFAEFARTLTTDEAARGGRHAG